MTTNNRELLRINTGVQDVQLFTTGFRNTPYARKPWGVQTNTIKTRFRLPLDNVGFAKQILFEIPKNGVLLDDIYLDLELGPLVPSGTGTYTRLCDYPAYAMVNNLSLGINNNGLQRKTGKQLFINHIRDHNMQSSDIHDEFVRGGLTEAERNTLATQNQVIRIPLKYFWYKLKCHDPLILSLSSKLKMAVDLASVGNFVESDYTNPTGVSVPIVSANLVYDCVQMVGKDRDEGAALVQRSERGITYLIEQTNSPTGNSFIDIPVGTSKFVYEIKGLSAPWSTIYGTLQYKSDVEGLSYQKKPYRYPTQLINSVSSNELREQNSIIQDFVGPFDTIDRWDKTHVVSRYRIPMLYFTVTEIADLKNQNMGSLNSQNIDKFHLVINFKAPTTEALSLDLTFFEHNWINHTGTTMYRLFNGPN